MLTYRRKHLNNNNNTTSGSAWCPVCGTHTHHEKYNTEIHGNTGLLVYSGELVDGLRPVQPVVSNPSDEGCPYWKAKQCTIHQGDRYFEVSEAVNSGQPVKRVPENITSQICRPPREGELVCLDCLAAAENGTTVMDLQEEFGVDRRSIYGKCARKRIGRRYVTAKRKRPVRCFTPEETAILREPVIPAEKPGPAEEDKPVFCGDCGTRLG